MSKKSYQLTNDQAEELTNLVSKVIHDYKDDMIWGPSMIARMEALKEALSHGKPLKED